MSSLSVDHWVFHQKRKPQPLTECELEIWQQFFAAPSSEIPQYAKWLALPIMKPISDPECRLTQFWSALADAVNSLTEHNDKLAQFVIELQRLPDGQGILGPNAYFHELPLFNDFWTRQVQFQSAADLDESDPSDPRFWADCQALQNQNTFLAKITALAASDTATKDNIHLDQRERGGQAMVEALEVTPWDENSPTYRSQAAKVTVLNAYVPAAVLWIMHCGEGMYEKALAGGSRMFESPNLGTNWGVERGWSKERWTFWLGRLLEISKIPELEEGIGKLAKDCAEGMADIGKPAS
ncbi:hypothetical protein F4819DRAFT_505639 [Hypoxylon fuscum]|nr:hypothetical protein F4819DRAFT_505639 [Hypoxylon fuscum]